MYIITSRPVRQLDVFVLLLRCAGTLTSSAESLCSTQTYFTLSVTQWRPDTPGPAVHGGEFLRHGEAVSYEMLFRNVTCCSNAMWKHTHEGGWKCGKFRDNLVTVKSGGHSPSSSCKVGPPVLFKSPQFRQHMTATAYERFPLGRWLHRNKRNMKWGGKRSRHCRRLLGVTCFFHAPSPMFGAGDSV
jgi:hypothetical protein